MELRLYTFVNVYLSSIQAGIQSAHLVHDMFVKYKENGSNTKSDHAALWDWAKNHKTLIVLNGGPNEYIRTRWLQFQRELSTVETYINHGLPWGSFNEDEFSLGGVMTCVGVVLPECIFNAVDYRTASKILPFDVINKYQEGSYFWIQESTAGPYVAFHYPQDSEATRLIVDAKSCRLFGA